ncbi:MAG: MOFRL family protein [Nitrosomonas sp.]|nr:MOFRL family protein [Nitrosomonas sp.]
MPNLLSLAIALGGLEEVYALACDTDGIDGSEINAGVVMTPDTLSRARQAGIDPAALLGDNDVYTFFESWAIWWSPSRTYTNE